MEYYKINSDACLEERSIYLSDSVNALYEQNFKYILQKIISNGIYSCVSPYCVKIAFSQKLSKLAFITLK